jgi:hypothetical protein
MDHQGPLTIDHPDYRGSSYNVLVKSEDCSVTYKPLDVMIKDDIITAAKYAEANELLSTPG